MDKEGFPTLRLILKAASPPKRGPTTGPRSFTFAYNLPERPGRRLIGALDRRHGSNDEGVDSIASYSYI
jgi:hypothetical protein